MKFYKLDTFTLPTEKFQKFKGYNGRSDIEYKLNNGILEIKNLIDYLYNLYDEVDVNLIVAYMNQKVDYYIGLSIEDDILDNIIIGRSTWKSSVIPDITFNEQKILFGACHVSTSDDLSLNLIDEIVRSHGKCTFHLEYSFTLSKKDTNYHDLLTKLANRIQALSQIKETTESAGIVIVNSSNQSKDISAETLYNYLSELYYLYRASSSICKTPKLDIYSESYEITDSIASIIIKRSQSRNAYCFDYWFNENAYAGLQNELKEKGFWGKLFTEDKTDEYLFDRNLLISQFVPTSFIASVVALPNTKIPGITYIDEYEFGSINDIGLLSPEALSLGCLYKNFQTELPIIVTYDDLVMHSLVTGVTGSGKTTTIKSMLLGLYENKKPFLILEPAKTEYKALKIEGLKRYLLGIETKGCLKINPFEFPYKKKGTYGVHIQTHLDLLKSIFIAAFPMYGPMPYVLETAFYHVYQWYGWDFKSGHNINWNSTNDKSDLFPTLDDLYNAIDHIVSIQGYSKDLQNDLTAALKVRIGSLKSGAKGTMLNTKRGTCIGELLSCPTVVELERIGDAQEKVFIMGLLLVSIYEHYVTQDPEPEVKLKHLLVIEEAHRLLENVQQSNNNEIADMKGKAIETFNNILSEIRAYGQGIIVADQIPTKISPDVIKNTNLKIIHRLFSLDDRNAVGDAIGLDTKQKKGLIHLNTGEAIVFHSGLQEAVKIMVDPRGKDKGNPTPIDESKDLNTLDVVVSTTAIYSEVKKVFQATLVFGWNYTTLQEKLRVILGNFSMKSDEELISQLASNLVEWFAIKLRNNTSIPYSFPKENELKKLCNQPGEAIEGIRSFIERNKHTIHFPKTLNTTYVDALVYFIYIYAEDRKAVSKVIATIESARGGRFRYYDTETQSIIMAESDIEKYFCTADLSEDEITELCQCLVHFCSYAHTDFKDYFDQSNKPISDEEYLKQLKTSDKHKPATESTITSSLENDIKPLLESIAGNLKEIGQKQVIDPAIKNVIRLPLVLLLANTLLIILAVIFILIR